MSGYSRYLVFGLSLVLATLSLLLVAVVRERDALPGSAARLLQATTEAAAVTTCLQGVQDELFLPGVGRLETSVARHAALARLRTCDVVPLERAVAAVDLPPRAPVDRRDRRRAYDNVDQGLALLRRVVLDTRGAARAMSEDVSGRRAGPRVVLAYRSASAGSDAAYAYALHALALLGETPGTRPPPG